LHLVLAQLNSSLLRNLDGLHERCSLVKNGFLKPFRDRAREETENGFTGSLQVRAQLLQDLGGHALALADEPEEDVLGADVVVPELKGLPKRQLQHLLRPRGERDVAGGDGLALAD